MATINIFAGSGEHPELSNFAVTPFISGIGRSAAELRLGTGSEEQMFSFDSVEQAFQYAKTLYSSADEREIDLVRNSILETTDGAELRRLGHGIPQLDSAAWDAVSARYMSHFLKAKFSQVPEARAALLATGDAVLTHVQDRTRWREEFPRLLMEVREGLAQSESIVNGQIPWYPAIGSRTADIIGEASHYDILTLGTGTRSEDEFYSLIPPGVTHIIDTRQYRRNSHYPHFDTYNFLNGVTVRGLTYEWMPELSGKSRDPRMFLEGNAREFDWVKMSSTEEFRNGVRKLADLTATEKVLIVSGGADPRYGNRAMLIGQAVESLTGKRVAHIDTDRSDNVRLRSNRDVITDVVGYRSEIVGGSYINIHFNSDRSYVTDPGVSVVKKDISAPAESRLISGSWNYGNSVEFMELSEENVDGAKPSTFKAAYIRAAQNADITVAISIGGYDRGVKQAKAAAAGSVVSINVRDSKQDFDGTGEEYMTVKELLTSPEYIAKVGDRLHDDIARNLTIRSSVSDHALFDLNKLKVSIVGTDIARIANELVTDTSPVELSGQDLAVIAEGGLRLDSTDVSQEDVNVFVKGILSRAQRPVVADEFAQEDDVTFHISDIITTGQTGVGEAGTIAAQAMGLNAHVVAPRGFGMTIDNETAAGMYVADEAMFKNRFHQGLRNAVTPDDLKRALDVDRYMRERRENRLGYGLTDMQILTMSALGYSNTDIITMAELADGNSVVLTSDADMLEFLTTCAANGIAGSDILSEDAVTVARRGAERMVAEAYGQGIGFITVNSPAYPENLRQVKDEQHTVYTEELVTNNLPADMVERILSHATVDGALHTDRIPKDILDDGTVEVVRIPHVETESRPAILWYKGDIELLRTPTVSLHGNYTASDTTMPMAKALGRRCANDGVTVVSNLSGGTSMVASREAVDWGGGAIAVSPDSITGPAMEGLKQEIISNGGLVLSEKAPGNDETTARDMQRSAKFATTLGYVSAFIDGFSAGRPLSPFELVPYALYGAVALSYSAISSAEGLFRTEGNREAQKAGMQTAGITELDKVTDLARNAFGEGAAEQLSAVQGFKPERGETRLLTQAEPQHPKQYQVNVVHFGSEKVFLVPENIPDVRKAVQDRFGTDVKFADPRDADLVYDRFLHRTIFINGETMNAFEGYRSTQPQEKEPYIFPMFYVDGKITTMSYAPDTTLGLVPKWQRTRNAALFHEIKTAARDIQREMQNRAGLTSLRAFHFDSADHIVIKPNSVEIRRGDSVRAKVYITSKGELRAANFQLVGDDLNEHGTRQFDVFSNSGLITNETAVKNILSDISATVFDRCVAESDYLSPKDRAAQEQMDREIQEGFLVPREDNLTLAIKDVHEAELTAVLKKESDGKKEEQGNSKTVSKVTAMGLYCREMAREKKQFKSLQKEAEKIEKALNSTGTTPDERAALEDRLDTVEGAMLKSRARLTYMEEHKIDVVLTNNLNVVSTGDDASVKALEIEGLMINIASTKDLTPLQEQMAMDEVAAMQERVQEIIGQRGEAPNKEKKTDGENVGNGRTVVTKEDVISDMSNGLCIVKVGDKQAYADENLVVRSNLYHELKPMGRGVGLAYNEDGRFKLIRSDGSEMLPRWLDGVARSVDSVSVIKSDGLFNHIDLRTGTLLRDEWSAKAGQFSDGWSLIIAAEGENAGKANYISSAGKLMADKWFDSATSFREGMATVTRNGTSIMIDKEGIIQSVIEEEKSQGLGIK